MSAFKIHTFTSFYVLSGTLAILASGASTSFSGKTCSASPFGTVTGSSINSVFEISEMSGGRGDTDISVGSSLGSTRVGLIGAAGDSSPLVPREFACQRVGL